MTIKIIEIKIKKKNYFLLKGVIEKKLIELKIKKQSKGWWSNLKWKIKTKFLIVGWNWKEKSTKLKVQKIKTMKIKLKKNIYMIDWDEMMKLKTNN